MVHGHTHRPWQQALAPGFKRHVLSDWDLDDAAAPRAEVLRLTRDGFAARASQPGSLRIAAHDAGPAAGGRLATRREQARCRAPRRSPTTCGSARWCATPSCAAATPADAAELRR
jgi:hypothetical protein